MKAEPPLDESASQAGDELAAEHSAEHLHGKKERVARSDPTGVIERQPTGRNNAVYVWMVLQLLIPGMQHAEEADLCAEVFWIAGDFDQGFRTGAEQQIVDY